MQAVAFTATANNDHHAGLTSREPGTLMQVVALRLEPGNCATNDVLSYNVLQRLWDKDGDFRRLYPTHCN
jgi:hypothetical protein